MTPQSDYRYFSGFQLDSVQSTVSFPLSMLVIKMWLISSPSHNFNAAIHSVILAQSLMKSVRLPYANLEVCFCLFPSNENVIEVFRHAAFFCDSHHF